MTEDKIKVNRAPVLTLWAAVVAERLGYDHDTALTLGRAVAGLNAYSKGLRLGIFEQPGEVEERARSEREPDATFQVTVLGRPVPAVHTPQGIRALSRGQPINPDSVASYLTRKFKGRLADVQAALSELAASMPPGELARQAYELYEQFRPAVPEGTRGWGAEGDLDLSRIRGLAATARK